MEYISPPSGLLLVTGILAALVLVTSKSRSSLAAQLPGPPAASWIYGNMLQLSFPSFHGEFEYEWQKKYGSLYRIKGMFGQDRLMVSDPVAVQHIINSRSFIRAPTQLQMGKLVFGERSIACAEGDDHRRIRAALNPGFSSSVVRSFLPIFSDVAGRIVQEWDQLCSPGLGPTLVNVCDLLDHATLDIISEAALGLPLNTVADPKHPLAQSHLHVLRMALSRSKQDLFGDALLPYIPTFILRSAVHLPTAVFRALQRFRSVTDAMGSSLIRTKTEEQETGHAEGNDVLSILIKGLSGRKQKLTASELAEQIRAILLAGQDTSANALAWCLYELAKDHDYQRKLRAEIELHRSGSEGQMEYDSMPLLNAFIKEVLRVYPAAPYLERVPCEDLVIPLASEIILKSGERVSHLPVKKGQYIAVAIASYQQVEALWGSDAAEFKPSRWLKGDPCKGKALGPYGHLLTFSGGYRVCAGWRFSVLEMQVILAELVLNFSFRLSEDDPIRCLFAGIVVPITKNGVKGLPLFIEHVAR
ncbi:cytochrome P450 [Mycena capillaripes]|nr:cytochrome P450 [Mycena capillaripes]